MENQVEFKAEKSVLCWPDEKIRVCRQSDIKQWNYAKLRDDRERISYGKLSEKLDACDNLVMVHVILAADEHAQGRSVHKSGVKSSTSLTASVHYTLLTGDSTWPISEGEDLRDSRQSAYFSPLRKGR